MYLCSQKKNYVDGTFEYCTKFFSQLFTIHTIENGHYIPLVFILLPNKLTQTYAEAFKCLKSLCDLLQPEEFVCDFEMAIHVAVKKIRPNIEIVGCKFHLTQSWFRKIQNLGIVSDYKNKDSEIGKWLRWTFGLLYLDAPEVENCFVEDLYSVIPQNEKVIKYADYLVDNYISDEAIFKPEIWASCTNSRERTTNACESFHSQFNKNFYSPHPDIYRFLDVLKEVQLDTYIKINSVHEPVACKNVKYGKRHEYVGNLVNVYKNNGISRFDFVKTICYQCNK